MNGKVVLITGAARGIGAESARRLARRGARVALVGLEPEELRAVAAGIGPDALAIEADVTDTPALERAVAATLERFGRLDFAFANAGIAAPGMVRSMDPASFQRTLDVNLFGVWRTARACLPELERSRGYFLINASVSAIASTFPAAAPYAVSKTAVEALGNTMRAELKHRGVGVGVAYFHWIATDLVRGADENPVLARMRAQLKGPMGKTYPVGQAADAVVRGMERRSRVVVAPWWVRAMLPLRGLVTPLGERDMLPVVPDIEAALEADARERGAAAYAPVGAGGAAAARSVEAKSVREMGPTQGDVTPAPR